MAGRHTSTASPCTFNVVSGEAHAGQFISQLKLQQAPLRARALPGRWNSTDVAAVPGRASCRTPREHLRARREFEWQVAAQGKVSKRAIAQTTGATRRAARIAGRSARRRAGGDTRPRWQRPVRPPIFRAASDRGRRIFPAASARSVRRSIFSFSAVKRPNKHGQQAIAAEQ